MALSAAPVETFASVPPAQNRFSLSLFFHSFSPSHSLKHIHNYNSANLYGCQRERGIIFFIGSCVFLVQAKCFLYLFFVGIF